MFERHLKINKMKSKKQKKDSPKGGLKQMKISAFCIKKSEKRPPDEDDDIQILSTPKKFAEASKTPEICKRRKVEDEDDTENTPPAVNGCEVMKESNLNVEKIDSGIVMIDDIEILPKIFADVLKTPEKEKKKSMKDGEMSLLTPEGSKSGKKSKSDSVLQNVENFDFGFDDIDFEEAIFKSPVKIIQNLIDFSTSPICEVLRIDFNQKPYEQVLTVKNHEGGEMGICKLRDVWAYTVFNINDLVSIKAVSSEDGWVVDAKNGYVSIFPNELVTTTSLVGAMFCMRRAVLSHYYRGFDQGNKIMVVGRLVHELLQSALRIDSCSESDIEELIENSFKNLDVMKELYSCDMTLEQASLELKSFVPKILNFLDVYVKGGEYSPGQFEGKVTEIVDIEEDVIAPKLGIKGRIDVTVKVDGSRVMPLELKTGRASFSNEHKFQVALYTMIMKELGRQVDSGLLLYLREGSIEEIKPTQVEIRDLILLKNQFVKYLKNFKELDLPEPIRFEKGCQRCPYLTICYSFLKDRGFEDLSPNHPMRTISAPEVKKSHIEYFVKWTKLCFMEMCEDKTEKCYLGELVLEEGVVEFKNEFKHVFKKNKNEDVKPGSFIFVSDDKNKRVCYGKVINVTETHCSVLLDKELTNREIKYRLETYNSSMLGKYLTNLGCLLDEGNESLREIIIDKKLPIFQEKLEKKLLTPGTLKILKPLNEEQRTAVLKVLTCESYVLIKGPPGTGKTQTIIALIKILVGLNQSILITGHTHSSVDNILLRLTDVKFVRFGTLKSINKQIHTNSYATLLQECKTIEDIKKLHEAQVIATTCLGVDPDLITKRKFDVCLIDESSQVLQPEALKPLFCAKKFVLIGDSNQLPPIVQNREAKKLNMDESLFERLENDASTVSLRLQYRMNRVINDLANKITYNGGLECANEEISKAVIKISPFKNPAWLSEILSPELDKSVVFISTSNYFKRPKQNSESCASNIECKIITKLTKKLIELDMPQESIGIISPFRAQVELLINENIKNELKNIDVSTVDQYQGRDKEVIIYSCAKENQSWKIAEEFELLNDKRRLNVAVTRAKHKLIVVGDVDTVKAYKPLERLIKCLGDEQFVELEDGVKEFSWDDVLGE